MSKIGSAISDERELAYSKSFEICLDQRYLVQNRTPEPLLIPGRDHGDLLLAPLAERVMIGKRLAPFEERLRELRQQQQVRVRKQTAARTTGPVRRLAGLVAVCIAVLLGLAGTAAI